jgi:hypothetical protein
VVNERKIDTVVDLRRHTRPPSGGSDKAFGFVLGGFFALVGLYPLLRAAPPRWWAFVIAVPFLLAAAVRPQLLSPLNRLWTRLGLLLGRIVSPLALFVVYCLAIVPTGLVLRSLRRDPLKLHKDPNANSYWIDRSPPGRADAQMKRQF